MTNSPLVPTAWATIGPFFPETFFREGDNDLTRLEPGAPQTAEGSPMWLTGRVLQEGGGACVNAVLEAWQADAGGRFRHPRDPAWRQADPRFLGWDAPGRMRGAASPSGPSSPAPTPIPPAPARPTST